MKVGLKSFVVKCCVSGLSGLSYCSIEAMPEGEGGAK